MHEWPNFCKRVLRGFCKPKSPHHHSTLIYYVMFSSSSFWCSSSCTVQIHSECGSGCPFLSSGYTRTSLKGFLLPCYLRRHFERLSQPSLSVSRGQILSLVSRPVVTSSVEHGLMLPPTLGRHCMNIHSTSSFLSFCTIPNTCLSLRIYRQHTREKPMLGCCQGDRYILSF